MPQKCQHQNPALANQMHLHINVQRLKHTCTHKHITGEIGNSNSFLLVAFLLAYIALILCQIHLCCNVSGGKMPFLLMDGTVHTEPWYSTYCTCSTPGLINGEEQCIFNIPYRDAGSMELERLQMYDRPIGNEE